MLNIVSLREYFDRDKKGYKSTEDLDLILDYTTWLYDDENPEETPYYLSLKKDPHKLSPKIKFIYWRQQKRIKYHIYAFLRISFIIPQRNRVNISPDEIRKMPLARQMITDYLRKKTN